MDCDEIDSLLAGAALGAATPHEIAEIERHVATCSRHPQWADYKRVAETLPTMIPSAAPSLEVKRRLMARVYRDLEPRSSWQAWWRAGSGWLVAAAVAVAAVFLGVRDYALSGQLASAPGHWQLQPAGAGIHTTGTLVWLPSQGTATLTLRQLPALQQASVYEVWLIKDAHPVAAGVFRPGSDNSASTIIQGDPADFDTVAVTREPGPSGSQAPTTQPFVSGKLR